MHDPTARVTTRLGAAGVMAVAAAVLVGSVAGVLLILHRAAARGDLGRPDLQPVREILRGTWRRVGPRQRLGRTFVTASSVAHHSSR